MQNCDLSFADLFEANLSFANLSGADLSDANLWEANLYGANLEDANLEGANFTFADLSCANLSEANLNYTIFAESIWDDCNITDENADGYDDMSYEAGANSVNVGDMNEDGGWNVLDIVALANCVLSATCGD